MLLLGLADFLVVSRLPAASAGRAAARMGGNRDWAWAPMVVVVGGLADRGGAGPGRSRWFCRLAAERGPLLLLIASVWDLPRRGGLLQMSTLAPAVGQRAFYAKAAGDPGAGERSGAEPGGRCFAQHAAEMPGLRADLRHRPRPVPLDQRRARLLLLTLIASALVVMVYALYTDRASHSCYLGGFLEAGRL